MNAPVYIGIFEGHFDPAVAAVRNGEVIAYAEEERFVRFKHAPKIYPVQALKYCLDAAEVRPQDVAALAVNWDVTGFTNGRIADFFTRMGKAWPLDEKTLGWQRFMLGYFNRESVEARHRFHWQKTFGELQMPNLVDVPHHYVHAYHAYAQSRFNDALCITVDGSGDEHCTVLWHCHDNQVEKLREICMPHSLGWFYAAITEYLGFAAYDGEYKVMGLAAYGRPNAELAKKMQQILFAAEDGVEYRLDPRFIHYGPRNWSDRFTDHLPELFGRPMRLGDEPTDQWHEDVAYAAQRALEQSMIRLAKWGLREIGSKNLCVGGGVGLNVKMNSKLFELEEIQQIFAQPLCSDGGAAAGAALCAWASESGRRPVPIETLALGNEESNDNIEQTLKRCGIRYEKVADVAVVTARELADGKIVGWFQGRMEAGPRALGQRSILADPRDVAARDKVNAVIKYREKWRPFCPSMAAEAAPRYFEDYIDAPFMIIAFEATQALAKEAPAIVHIDGTARVQMVHKKSLPRYHALLTEFGAITGTPVLLNTSFNVRGEPVVCTINDAIRTFFATGLDTLVAGDYIIRKGHQHEQNNF